MKEHENEILQDNGYTLFDVRKWDVDSKKQARREGASPAYWQSEGYGGQCTD